jgi:predicted nucleotidyltransferase
MDKQDILARLRENEAALKAQGVCHAALFVSRARGEPSPDSDIDILAEIAADVRMDLFQYVEIVQYIEEGQQRWRSDDGKRLYTWDSLHGEVEVFNRRGRHLGALHPVTGDLVKEAVPGRRIDV